MKEMGRRTSIRTKRVRIFSLEFFLLLVLSMGTVISLAYAQGFIYDDKGNRDPFIPLVGPGAPVKEKGALDITSISDVRLEGIIYDERGGSLVMMNGIIVKEGEEIGAAKIESVGPKKVIFEIMDELYEIPLIEEDEEVR